MRGFRPFSGSPGLRAGSGAADFLHVRHPIPQSRFASVGECKPRSRPGRVVGESGWGGGVPVCRVSRVRRLARGRAGCWQIRVGRRCPGLSDLPGSEARPRPCGLLANQEGGCPGLPKTRGACLFVRQPGRAVGCRYGCRPARKRRSGRMPGRLRPDARPAGIAWVSQPNRAVGLPERGACCGYGRSAVLARKNEGSPERLPSPSKINP